MTPFAMVAIIGAVAVGLSTAASADTATGNPLSVTSSPVTASQSGNLIAMSVDLSTSARVPLPKIWRATGWCPPLPLRDMPSYVNTESTWQNHAFIAALPRQGIEYIRIHNLLFLLRVPSGTQPESLDPTTDIDYSNLDTLVDLIVGEFGLALGFEIMGNPLFADATSDVGVFTSWKDSEQVAAWQRMVTAICQRYVDKYGLDVVARWRWEAWNEPDHACNSRSKMNAGIDCDLDSWLAYFDACARGVKAVSPRMLWGGPGSGGATLTTPFLAGMLKHVAGANGSNRTALDFIQWHDKGALTNTGVDLTIARLVQSTSPTLAASTPMGNEEVDPEGGWNKVLVWRGDTTYPAAAARVLNMHLAALRDDFPGIDYHYHANDNAFLNYGDVWYDQRTLVVRFLMNKTGATEVMPKSIYNLMGLLSLLGDTKYNVTHAPDPQTSPVGVLCTTGPSPTNTLESEAAVLAYNSAGTDNCTSGDCTAQIEVALTGLSAKLGHGPTVVTHYRIDQQHGNPRSVWESYGGASNPYPTPTQLAALRRASSLSVLSVQSFPTLPNNMTLSTNLPQPGVSLWHVCTLPSAATAVTPPLPRMVHNVSLRVTPTNDPPTVFVRWAPVGSPGSGCIATYEVLYRPTATINYTRINTNDTIFSAFVHAQRVDTTATAMVAEDTRTANQNQTPWPGRGTRATGCYAVRAVSVWGGTGPLSEPVCVPDVDTTASAPAQRGPRT
eukprot:m.197777 g.197777  ORF g.197777 m.197777 type:complete len:726 (+) comp20217_c0_seq1:47-2224(+)